jgi:hypothetical protein
MSWVALQVSVPPQVPGVVEHPVTGLQPASQHSSAPPGAHTVAPALQVHELQLPAPSHMLVQLPG